MIRLSPWFALSYYFLTNIFEHILVTGVHPRLVDRKVGKPLLREAKEHFPEWSEKEVIREILQVTQNKNLSVAYPA